MVRVATEPHVALKIDECFFESVAIKIGTAIKSGKAECCKRQEMGADVCALSRNQSRTRYKAW